ncbi:MAG: phosphatidylglycerophosphatase A [Phyllobacteriaceae bacterium]|nr:phosphatidylglycerophosphatase A [Phyllobacteriaceae bacterium]
MKFFWKLIATGFGAGYSPLAPGTMGAALACLILWLLHIWQPESFSGNWSVAHWLLDLILLFGGLGVAATDALADEWGHDPSKVVVDEMVGLWVAMLGIPVTWQWLLAAFVLFRIFDIWKPLVIKRAEALPGGWGVMADDVLAGIYSAALLHLFIFAKEIFFN